MIQNHKDNLHCYSDQNIQNALSKTNLDLSDFCALISPKADNYLETMATKAQNITRNRFGYGVALFAPLYISNFCYNQCVYCGFSMELDIKRHLLSDTEIHKEAKLLKEKGFDHILLLTGEAPNKAGVSEIAKAIGILKNYVSEVGIEVQPMKEEQYKTLIDAGCDYLAIYQETYHKETYKEVHKAGKKRNFNYRLDAADRGGRAGFYKLNVGALLGLYDWHYEAIALFDHIKHLEKHYWQSKLSLSIPRLRPFAGCYSPKHPISDKDLLKFILAMRLCFPDLGISLSTREPAKLRDNLISICITQMSAESKTEPGGYSGKEALKQFEISDSRSLASICQLLEKKGLEPILKDWDKAYLAL